jgi:hypothetical protein
VPAATTVAFGLAGAVSPLTGAVPFAGLSARIAGVESVTAVLDQVVSGAAPLGAECVAWGLLALASRPAAVLRGRSLRVFAGGYAVSVVVASTLAPVVVGGAVAPVGPLVVGVVLAGILLVLRSAMRPPAEARPDAAPAS